MSKLEEGFVLWIVQVRLAECDETNVLQTFEWLDGSRVCAGQKEWGRLWAPVRTALNFHHQYRIELWREKP